jgi:hypothetical protein
MRDLTGRIPPTEGGARPVFRSSIGTLRVKNQQLAKLLLLRKVNLNEAIKRYADERLTKRASAYV